MIKNITKKDEKKHNLSEEFDIGTGEETQCLNKINSFFINVCPDRLPNKNVDYTKIKPNNHTIFFAPTTELEVSSCIKKVVLTKRSC